MSPDLRLGEPRALVPARGEGAPAPLL
jgi:hypothetical protein